MKKKNIAIDGPSGSGKSTIAKLLSEKLNYLFINTGLMYRAIAYLSVLKKIDISSETAVTNLFKPGLINLLPNNCVKINDVIFDKELKNDQIALIASKIAKFSTLRNLLVKEQQNLAKQKGVVMDGRDITTVVLPNAEVKIFLWASALERAKRREQQNKLLGIDTIFSVVLNDIIKRDYHDANREFGKLTLSPDAVKIDTTNLSISEVVAKIMKLIRNQK